MTPRLRLLVQTGLLAACLLVCSFAAEAARPNVLLICLDDLKPVLGCYGDPLAKTPNIDRLARRGVTFEKAYCNQALCSPSRNSLMTGMRPTSMGIYDLTTNFREAVPDAVTLPQYFSRYGFRTEALGKILHTTNGNHEDVGSWTEPHFWSDIGSGTKATASNQKGQVNKQRGAVRSRPAIVKDDVPDNFYTDGRIADEAVKRLGDAKSKSDVPWFMAVGFLKPHLPFHIPKRYWDMHDRSKFTPAENPAAPVGAPKYALTGSEELRSYAGIPKGDLPAELQRDLIHGYYAAVSYVDAQVGRVLDELDRQNLADRTIVVLWGDHGWHLGDHSLWGKKTNYEQAARIPLILAGPGVAQGEKSSALVETVDLYPTLGELAGLPIPGGIQEQ
ncbi:MAG: sulfatase, partial [Opitutaceae bacterium]|nr:sulfatase [Opitutaceae bacterium]